MNKQAKKVLILAPPGTGLLNLCGAWEVFSHANDVLLRKAYELSVFGPAGPHIITGHGLEVGNVRPLPRTLKTAPHLIIVAGGHAFTEPSEHDLDVARWLKCHARRAHSVVSICAGAFTLGYAGLLDGRKATTHWMALERLASAFPKARVVDEGIYVRDGRIWTSAGITAGIDLCLALVERDHGHTVAMHVAQRLVLFLHRSGNQAQFSAALRRQVRSPSKLDQLTSFIVENLGQDLRVVHLASALGMSARTLSRLCKAELGESPAEVVRRFRVEEAAHLLSATDLPLKGVAARSGLGDPSTLWRSFQTEYGLTPDEYRTRFSSVLSARAS